MDWNKVKEIMKERGFAESQEIRDDGGNLIELIFNNVPVTINPQDAEYVPDYSCIINADGNYKFVAHSPTNLLCIFETTTISCYELEKHFNGVRMKYEDQLMALQRHGGKTIADIL